MVRRMRHREAAKAQVAPRSPTAQAVVVPTEVTSVVTQDDARELARRLQSADRRWPVAVVTVATDQAEPFADVDDLVEAVGGLVEVVVMSSSEVSWAFSEQMPPDTQVYGGASRVYPVGVEWVHDLSRSPLRFAYGMGERRRVTEVLVADAMAAAVAGGLLETRPSRQRRRVAGTVTRLFGTRAFVQLDEGNLATLWEELSGFDVPLARLVRAGQRIEGFLDPEHRRLDLIDASPEASSKPTALPDGYVLGCAVLAEVAEAARDKLVLRMVPGMDAIVGREAVTGNDLDALDGLFAAGDLVTARLTSEWPIALSLLDVDDDEEPLVAPSILAGGPPWLVPPALPDLTVSTLATEGAGPRSKPEPGLLDPDSAPEDLVLPDLPAHPRMPTPLEVRVRETPLREARPNAQTSVNGVALRATDLALQSARGEVRRLRQQVTEHAGLTQEVEQLRRLADTLERQLSQERARANEFRDKYVSADRSRQKLRGRLDHLGPSDLVDLSRGWFADPADALRFAVQVAWACRVPVGETRRSPLRSFGVGPRFVASLEQLGTVSWSKLAEVVLDILLADPPRLSALQHHPLRQGEGGNAPARRRDDGATCYRVALQQGSPSARRLHYWRRGEDVELSRVVLHDDVEP